MMIAMQAANPSSHRRPCLACEQLTSHDGPVQAKLVSSADDWHAMRVIEAFDRITVCERNDYDRLDMHWFVQCNKTQPNRATFWPEKTGRDCLWRRSPQRLRQSLPPARQQGSHYSARMQPLQGMSRGAALST